MTDYFIDSSALVKRFVVEPGTGAVVKLLECADRLAGSNLTAVEVLAAVVRRLRRSGLPETQVSAIVNAVEKELRELFELVAVDEGIRGALELVHKHGLRAADAIQLAAAVRVRSTSGDAASWCFVSSDTELNKAAQAEGFVVVDPSEPD